MSYSEDEIYELSYAREPRTSVSSPSTPSRTPSAFANWAKSISTPPDPQTIQKHVNAMADAVFKNYDHDRDGFISQAEFNEIAQNFPFIDSFAVLDADKDGLISRNEMKNYFLRANHHALKSEFKHEFHETTYFKPAFCSYCDGFLWGLIKQGWKCKDCGINVHRLCKDQVVIECRPKRSYNIPRQISTPVTNNEKIINRALFNRSAHPHIGTYSHIGYHPKLKQKSTQTEIYDDFFMSDDDSMTSNEDNNNRFNNLLDTPNSSLYHDTSSSSATAKSLTYSNKTEHGSASMGRRNREMNFKKVPKRRKSLPSQYSIIDEPPICTVPISLIPRGPLICSNMDNMNNWLPERSVFFAPTSHQLSSILLNDTGANNSINSSQLDDSKSIQDNLAKPSIVFTESQATQSNSATLKSTLNTTPSTKLQSTLSPTGYVSRSPYINKEFNLNDFIIDMKINKITKQHPIAIEAPALNGTKNNSQKYKESQFDTSLNKNSNDTNFLATDDNLSKKNNSNNNNSNNNNQNNEFHSQILDESINKIEQSVVINAASPSYKTQQIPNQHVGFNRKRVQSDCYDFNYLINSNVLYHSIDEEACSSIEDEDQDVFKKLKEAELAREKLARENAKIKQELESANAQINSLKEKISTIKIADNCGKHDGENN